MITSIIRDLKGSRRFSLFAGRIMTVRHLLFGKDNTALKQFELLNDRMLCDETREILGKICDMFKKAIIGKYEIFIGRE